MRSRPALLALAIATLAGGVPVLAQGPAPLPATMPLRFEPWQPASPDLPAVRTMTSSAMTSSAMTSRDRTRHAVIGGAIGAAAGLVACTTISTLADDSAEGGVSFCPLDSYLLIGGAGFLLGAAIGWIS